MTCKIDYRYMESSTCNRMQWVQGLLPMAIYKGFPLGSLRAISHYHIRLHFLQSLNTESSHYRRQWVFKGCFLLSDARVFSSKSKNQIQPHSHVIGYKREQPGYKQPHYHKMRRTYTMLETVQPLEINKKG